jgi:hypothetical protein
MRSTARLKGGSPQDGEAHGPQTTPLHDEPDAEELLEGAARLALPAFSFAPADGEAPSEAAILHGLYWLVAGLAARGHC